jgi:hypothetical protein
MDQVELFLELDNIFKWYRMEVGSWKWEVGRGKWEVGSWKFTTIFFFFVCFSVFSQSKINGISFVASDREITNEAIKPVIAIHANWVTLMPYGFMKTESDTSLVFNSKRQWINERKEGVEATSKLFKNKMIKVMLKPQIWIPKGGFTGHIMMKSEKDWIVFEENYEKFILFYAKIAQSSNCDLFCIGTEMNSFVIARPKYWKDLITKIKVIYKGEITYAENWDTYATVPFLASLDYIGIDAYFPLDTVKTPTVKAIEKFWQPLKKAMEQVSKKYNKKILFTEYGYQSKDFTTLEPWDHSKSRIVNLKGQENALTAIFNQFWNEDWFAGGFLWKWYDNYNEVGGINDSDYTVQNKPSEKIVKKQYARD